MSTYIYYIYHNLYNLYNTYNNTHLIFLIICSCNYIKIYYIDTLSTNIKLSHKTSRRIDATCKNWNKSSNLFYCINCNISQIINNYDTITHKLNFKYSLNILTDNLLLGRFINGFKISILYLYFNLVTCAGT